MPTTYFPFRWMVGTFQEILDSSSGNWVRIKSITDELVGGCPIQARFWLEWDFQIFLARRGFGLLLPLRLSATAARMRSFNAASSTLSPSWMSMARLTFPSRLELNRPEGSFNAAPLANVILTTLLYVSPVQTPPPWDQTGVPIHFHSSRISGSASCMISRTFASVFPRQSPSSLILSSINAEADSTGTGLFMYTSNSRTDRSRRSRIILGCIACTMWAHGENPSAYRPGFSTPRPRS